MSYLLDANVVIGLMRRNHRIGEKLRTHAPGEIWVSSIAMFELYYGMFRSERVSENLQALGKVGLPVLEFAQQDAASAGDVRARLGAAGTLIGPYDTMIAGHALARGMVLVTHNVREFARVPGLQLEDWEA